METLTNQEAISRFRFRFLPPLQGSYHHYLDSLLVIAVAALSLACIAVSASPDNPELELRKTPSDIDESPIKFVGLKASYRQGEVISFAVAPAPVSGNRAAPNKDEYTFTVSIQIQLRNGAWGVLRESVYSGPALKIPVRKWQITGNRAQTIRWDYSEYPDYLRPRPGNILRFVIKTIGEAPKEIASSAFVIADKLPQ